MKSKKYSKTLYYGEKYFLLGRELPLCPGSPRSFESKKFPGSNEFASLSLNTFFSFDTGGIYFHPPVANPLSSPLSYQEDFHRFIIRLATSTIRERILLWSTRLSLHPKKVIFRNQKTRWGSCSSTGTISMNVRLIGAPLSVIDYIVVHEMVHLIHMNHSSRFWDQVAKILPDYEHAEAWLKKWGHHLRY